MHKSSLRFFVKIRGREGGKAIITAVLSAVLFWGLFLGRIPREILLPISVMVGVGIAWFKHLYGHSHGGSSIDWLAQCSRWNTVNPLLKMTASVGALLSCVASPSILYGLTVFFLASCLIKAGGVSLHQYLSLLLLPLTFILLGSLGIVFGVSVRPEGIWYLAVNRWYLCVTPEAQTEAIHIMIKALGGTACLYFLSLSTPMQEIIEGLRKLHVPILMIELMYLIYRYIFILTDLHARMDISASSRLGYRNYRTALRTMKGISSNLMSLSFRKASASFDAMESRGYYGEIRFLQEDKPIKIFHLLMCGLGIFLLGLWHLIISRKGWI